MTVQLICDDWCQNLEGGLQTCYWPVVLGDNNFWVCFCHGFVEILELFDTGVGKSVRSSWFPVGCSGHVDPELFNCEVLPLHLVDLLQFFLLVLDPLGILIVFDLLLQYVLPELLYLSYILVVSQSGWSSSLVPCKISWNLSWTSYSVCTAHIFGYIFLFFVLWLVVTALDPLYRLWAAYLLLSCVSWGWSWVSSLSCWWCFHWCIQWWWICLLLVGLFVSEVFVARLVVQLLASYWFWFWWCYLIGY